MTSFHKKFLVSRNPNSILTQFPINIFRIFYNFTIQFFDINNMSNKLKTASSLSADSTQIRYQKALKQINKLIGVNTQLKDEINRDQQIMNELQYKLETKEEQIIKNLKEVTNLEMELANIINERDVLMQENEKLKKELSILKSQSNYTRPTLHKVQSKQYFQSEKVNGEQNAIYELQKLLRDRDLVINELKKRISNTENVSDDYGIGKIAYSQSVKKSLSMQQLTKKLAAANNYIQKLSIQCAELKSKIMRLQTTNQLLTSRSAKNLQKYSPLASPRSIDCYNIQTTNSAQVLKRYRKLEQQNRKITRKYEHLTNETHGLTQKTQKLQTENKKMQKQIACYQQLIKKQLSIINDLHVCFDEEVLKMTNQFKQKLQEQRESFSPGKVADNMKVIQGLQAQNKSLKKKFQLCSIQLTKCFKTLQVYKTKLNQFERDYSQLVAERDQLAQRLTKLQSSHRDRSIHSKGSGSRIINDRDRRNSMGKTEYLNHS